MSVMRPAMAVPTAFLDTLLFIILIITLAPASALAECSFTMECAGGYGSTTSGGYHDSDSCDQALGQAQSSVESQGGGCTFSGCTCTAAAPTPAGDVSLPQIQQQGDDLRRNLEIQQKKIEEERKQKEKKEKEEFKRKQAEGVKSLKGVSQGAGVLKGESPVETGLKGVGSPSGPGIKAGGEIPDLHPRSAAYIQRQCADELLGYAQAEAQKNQPDISEIRFLSDQALKALMGEPVEVECKIRPTSPYSRPSSDTEPFLPLYRAKAKKIIDEAENNIRPPDKRTGVQKTSQLPPAAQPQSAQQTSQENAASLDSKIKKVNEALETVTERLRILETFPPVHTVIKRSSASKSPSGFYNRSETFKVHGKEGNANLRVYIQKGVFYDDELKRFKEEKKFLKTRKQELQAQRDALWDEKRKLSPSKKREPPSP